MERHFTLGTDTYLTKAPANTIVGNKVVGSLHQMLRKGGGNWVEGDRFFNREADLAALEERVRDGTHTLLTAQRRMGKTSLVRELLRQFSEQDEFETVFVDLEAANDPADAVAEIAVQARPLQGAWQGIKSGFANTVRMVGDRVEALSYYDLKVTLRAEIDAGNWQQRGNAVFSALAASERPVVLAVDELPILVNRMLKGDNERVTPDGVRAVDELLSWLRKTGQFHKGRISMILSGSVGLEPLLEQAGISAHANIFSTYDLKPWSEDTAVACLAQLAETYEIDLPAEVRQDMCRRLRCCIPHHVQMYFDKTTDHLRRTDKRTASLEDVDLVYLQEMLSVRGQVDLQHYESRLRMILGSTGYVIAQDILTTTAISGALNPETIDRYIAHYSVHDEGNGTGVPSVASVLHLLEHDGYLERCSDGYRFASGLLEDWWQSRYGQNFTPVYEKPQAPRSRQ